jgi:hypothetical protein
VFRVLWAYKALKVFRVLVFKAFRVKSALKVFRAFKER